METVCDIVRKMEENDSKDIIHSKYVSLNLREDINKTDAYLNSKHISGEKDSLGRDKSFFNICIAARNIWYRATVILLERMRFKATKKVHVILAFIAEILLKEWIIKSGFEKFLIDWGIALANYGSAISKFVEKDGELICEVSSWNRMLVDPIDFENNIKVEKLWLTPAQLRKNKFYDKETILKLIEAQTSRDTIDKQKKDDRPGYILVNEVHGEMSMSLNTGDEKDKDTYEEQTFAVSFMAKKDGKKGEYDDYVLYKGKSNECYDIAHLIKVDGYTFSGGAPKYLFQNQWMVNHSVKTIKDALDLSSKIIFQTSDGNFIGQNALTSIEQGAILIHANNQPVTLLNNRSDTVSLQNQTINWKQLGNEIAGVSESMLGLNPPSSTGWHQTEAILRENHSLFGEMTKSKESALQKMFRKFVIPHLKKKMDTSEEISAILADHQITRIDQMYVPNEAIRRNKKKIKDMVLADNFEGLTPEWQIEDTQIEAQKLQQELNQQGNQRFIKPSDIKTVTWKDLLKDFEWELAFEGASNAANIQDILTTLNNTLKFIISLGGRPMTPEEKLLFNAILTQSNSVISPLELSQVSQKTPAIPINGGQQMVGAGQPVGQPTGQPITQ